MSEKRKEMRLVVLSPERGIYDGEVADVTLPGSLGRFEVLNGHAALVSTLEAGEVRCTEPDGTERAMAIRGGFAEVKDNEIVVCAEL